MVSVMNASDLPNFGVDSSGKTRVSEDTVSELRVDGVNGGRESSELVTEVSKNKVGVRVLDEYNLSGEEADSVSKTRKMGSKESGGLIEFDAYGKIEKLTMKEDVDRKVTGRSGVLDFDSAYAKVDEGAAARMSEAFGLEAEKALTYGFEPGDMVWGKVKSHPWWPGHVFNEAFASIPVRKTKRQGHVLVAFFGDSSYGWFDPAELIPFEPHYAEKSRQTSSKSFLKAVFEAMDEASRRCALGLTCRCRNPSNFRPTSVRGYFAIDVSGYEPGAVYSVMQIKKARERFQPAEALSFVQQLALTPMSFERKNIDFIMSKATLLAFRKAAFEEFDETYAQAFGMQPVRPSREELDQIAKMQIRAPLSGPMVIAEALGEGKSTSKSAKVKEQSKKDKYLFKRRDETNEPRPDHIARSHEGVTVSSANKDGVGALTPKDYVLQKRIPVLSTRIEVPVPQDGTGTITRADNLVQGFHEKGAESVDMNHFAVNLNPVDVQVSTSHIGLAPVGSPVLEPVTYRSTSDSQVALQDGTLHLDGKNVLSKIMTPDGAVSSSVCQDASSGQSDLIGTSHSSNKNLQPEAIYGSRGERSKLFGKFEDFEPYNQRSSMAMDGPDQVGEGASDKDLSESVATHPVPIDAHSSGMVPHPSIDGLVKKTKSLKRPVDLNSERSFVVEKKKRLKKESEFESSSEHSHKRSKPSKEEEIHRKSSGKLSGIGFPSEKSQLDLQWRNNDSSSTAFSSDSALSPPKDLGNVEVELPQVVNDMLALALDPFYGVERNSAAFVRQILLRFRSLVYQKSLVLSPGSEVEALESSLDKTTASTTFEFPSGEEVRGSAPRHPKHVHRPEDPTKAGRKRSLSERQEEISAKRHKKLDELRLRNAERKAGSQKIPEVQREQKDTKTSVPAKPFRLDSAKKSESPARLGQPAMLIMKFPQQTSLPSVSELKVRFGRFGPLDHDAIRIFWKSFTCRVPFKHKAHAQAAYSYAVRNKALFGNVNVNYQLKDVGGQAPSEAESARWPANGSSDEFRPTGGGDSVLGPRPMTPPVQWSQQPNSQLKSCLKKPAGDEVGSSVSVSREVPRVKFMLGEEDSNRGELTGSSSKDPKYIGTSADGGAPSSSIAMDVNSKNFQKVLPQSLPPILPFPPIIQDVHETLPVGHQINVEPINFNNYFTTTITTTTTVTTMPQPTMNHKSIDISHQMLNLLTRCNDIVTDVKCSLGYVPYHPL